MSTDEGSPATATSLLVVDASVVIKWHVAEIHSDAARRLLSYDAPVLHAPDLLYPEIGRRGGHE